MPNENKKTIVISDQYIFTPRLENAEEMSTSPFAGIYRDAVKSLTNICDQTTGFTSDDLEPSKECNPIIAFIGERGSGKSSAIASFMRVLKESHKDENYKLLGEHENLKKYRFDVLPMIDPTSLSRNESLLGVIAAHMYRKIGLFQNEFIGKHSSVNSESDIRSAALELNKLYDALRTLNQERSDQFTELGGYEHLDQLSMSYNLRERFKCAVDAYLALTAKLHGSTGKVGERRFLVIPIDDLDMNAKHGYRLCEDIRKYMMVPGVVVLLAAKIEQLQSVIAMQFIKQLPTQQAVSNIMAERYLSKLIPISRRHALPILTVHNVVDYWLSDPKNGDEAQPLVNTLFKLLYNRLGVVLVKNDCGSHTILPRTLRGIVHLYYLLRKMPPVFDQCNTTPLTYNDELIHNMDKLPSNIDAFWDHFLNSEMEEIDHLGKDGSLPDLLLQMRTEHWSSVNRLVVKAVHGIMKAGDMLPDEESDHKTSIADICSFETMKENVSLGDALYMLDRLETWAANPQCDRFIAAVRTAYSLLLTRMFFVEQRPDNMRRFIVQLNNPDMQPLARPAKNSNLSVDIENDSRRRLSPRGIEAEKKLAKRRDWMPRVDMNSIGLRGNEQNTSLAGYFSDMQKRMKTNTMSIIYDDNPLKWLILNTVWCGYQRNLNSSCSNWRRVWEEPYQDSIELLRNPNTTRIAINYFAFITNLLCPCIIGNQDERGTEYKMIFPLYSADLIQFVVRNSKAKSDIKDAQKSTYYEYFIYFIKGISESITKINDETVYNTKRPYTIAMEPLDSPVMKGYERVNEIEELSQPEKFRLSEEETERVQVIRLELESQRRAGKMVKYCEEILRMLSHIYVSSIIKRTVEDNKRQNEGVSARANSVAGTQRELARALGDIIERHGPVNSNG